MAKRIENQYRWLRTARPDVDWIHVSPVLLRQLNAMGRSKRLIITIFSGYRSDAYSAKVGGFAGDPHTRHIAVDATANGKEIGLVFSAADFKRFGLRSGNQKNFYHGKTDPSHVDLVGTDNANAAAQDSKPAAPTTPAAAPAPTGTSDSLRSAEGAAAPLPQYGTNVASPGVAPPQALDPGTVQAGGFSPIQWQQMWREIASQDGASPDTVSYAGLLNQ